MSRSTLLVLACLASALALLPLAVKKPGLPMQPRAEEPTWYLMAASLAHDGDLACGPEDLRRLFASWPWADHPVLELARPALEAPAGDAAPPLVFARPWLYPLLAAPWVALFGANGPVALNLLLLCVAIAVGAAWLARPGEETLALLWSAGFFLVAAPFAWAFVISPEVLVMTAVISGLVLAWRAEERGAATSARRAAAAGAVLALAVYQQPWCMPLALVPSVLWLAERRPRPALACLGAGVASLAVVGALALWLTGSAHPALGPVPVAVGVPDPVGKPPLPELVAAAATAQPAPPERLAPGDFLWGRHGGLLPYFPWVLPALVWFALDGRRNRRRLALAAVLALTLAVIWARAPSAQMIGGDGAGNPLLVGLYPGFLLLARALRPVWLGLAGFALGALLLGSLLFVPFGAPVVETSFQAHTRNPPLAALPLELAQLPALPDYQAIELGEELRVWSRRDQLERRGNELALLGGDRAELWVEAPADLGSALLVEVESPAAPNTVTLDFAGTPARVQITDDVPAKTGERLRLSAERPTARRHVGGKQRAFYRLTVASARGERNGWRESERAGRGFAVGARLLFLGLEEWLERDLFHAEWLGCGAPRTVRAGEEFLVAARLRNTSQHRWPTSGPAWVRLSYHWLDGAGAQVSYNGVRTELAAPVAPGESVETWQRVVAPETTGSYLLELDPVFERVAWFSTRGVATCRQPIEVIAGAPADGASGLPAGTVPPATRGR